MNYLDGPSIITGVLIRGGHEGKRRGEVIMEAEVRAMRVTSQGDLPSKSWKTQGNRLFASTSERNSILRTHFVLLSSRTIR